MRIPNLKVPGNNSISGSPGDCQGAPDHSRSFSPPKFLSSREGKRKSRLHFQMSRNLCGRLSQIRRGFMEPSGRNKKVKG